MGVGKVCMFKMKPQHGTLWLGFMVLLLGLFL